MRTPALILDYVTMILINDLNMQTVGLKSGISRFEGVEQRLPVIEITFQDITKSDWCDILNTKLKSFLEAQEFVVTKGEENNLFVFLL